MKKMRLDKFLAKCGHGTRTEVKRIVRAGRVTVDGIEAKDAGMPLAPAAVRVEVDGSPLKYREHHYLMLNKPAGVISATRDRLHKTVLELLPPEFSHVDLFPVGRLDRDTQGLLILTDDGILAHRLLSPKKHVPKTYLARVSGTVDQGDVQAFAQGIDLEDFTTLPARLEILQAEMESLVRVIIFEGKFHQVKRMFKALGKEVLELTRVAMGDLELDPHLLPGKIRELSPQELSLLQKWR